MTHHPSFAEAAEASGSDKFHHHGYHRFYPHHLDRFRDTDGNLVEIGLDEGKSLQLWRAYLPQAFLHGVDVGMELQGDRWIVHRCDQSDPSQLAQLTARIGSAFAVIDDGSHIPEHQLLTFNLLFDQLLQPGGVYILEDIEVSYWRRGVLYGYPTRYGLHDSLSLMAVMKLLADWVNREFLSAPDRSVLLGRLEDRGLSRQVCDAVSSIEFAHNCVILRKREPWELVFDNRAYKFFDYL
jgi:hypothetical protein